MASTTIDRRAASLAHDCLPHPEDMMAKADDANVDFESHYHASMSRD